MSRDSSPDRHRCRRSCPSRSPCRPPLEWSRPAPTQGHLMVEHRSLQGRIVTLLPVSIAGSKGAVGILQFQGRSARAPSNSLARERRPECANKHVGRSGGVPKNKAANHDVAPRLNKATRADVGQLSIGRLDRGHNPSTNPTPLVVFFPFTIAV